MCACVRVCVCVCVGILSLLSPYSVGTDFSGAVQTVTIRAGETEACANIMIVNDNIQEGPEQFCVEVEIVGEVPNSEVTGTAGCQICVTINDPQGMKTTGLMYPVLLYIFFSNIRSDV